MLDGQLSRAFVHERCSAAAEFVRDAVIPLYAFDPSAKPDSEGSGVLLKIGPHGFVCSAAHVFESAPSRLLILLPNSLHVQFENNARKSHQAKEYTGLDVGFVRLTPDETNAIPPGWFLNLWNMGTVEYAARPAIYMGLGYPINTQERDDEVQKYYQKTTLLSGVRAPDRAYQWCKLHPNAHILFRNHSNRVIHSGGVGGSPKMRGISGGGIWRINPFQQYAHDAKPILVGVMTGRRECYKDAIHGGRIGPILAFIQHVYPDLRDYIPNAVTQGFKIHEV